MKSEYRRICGIKFNCNVNYSCFLLTVYMPCDSSNNIVKTDYSDCINCIETIFNSTDFNAFI